MIKKKNANALHGPLDFMLGIVQKHAVSAFFWINRPHFTVFLLTPHSVPAVMLQSRYS